MKKINQFRLLKERRFAPFFITQFLGAGNDNIFKFALTVLSTYSAAEWGGLNPEAAGAVIGGLFILPFVLFSATSGQLADKYEKSRLIRFVKDFEIAVMLLVAAGFIWKHVSLLFLGIFLMGVHSTIFGPVKYAYLPQHLNEEELTGGNGMVEMGTFVAILLGTLTGGTLAAIPGSGPVYVAVTTLVAAGLGRITAGFVPHSPPADAALKINWNPVSETLRNLAIARGNRTVFLSMLGISWLWFFGSIFLISFAGFSKEVLGGNQSVVTLLLAVFSTGIGLGSLLCERLSGHKVEIGLVPFGSIGMTVFAVDLYFSSHGMAPTEIVGLGTFLSQSVNWRIMADFFLLALFGGFYSVPLYALIQSRCEPSHRARIIAANNILNAIFMVVASIMTALLIYSGLSIPQIFLITGVLNALVAVYIYLLVPEFLMRFIIWLLIHSVYRLKEEGLDNIPEQGPAVLICNHVSYVDALVIAAACRRPIRFVTDYRVFRLPVLNFVFRTGRAIPIAPAKEDSEMLVNAYAEVATALRAGDLVGIFPEGRITDSGEINPFRPGIRRIVETTPVPVIPMALRGLWGSFFSRKGDPAMFRLWRGVFSKIVLAIGSPIPPEQARMDLLQKKVLDLRGNWK